METRHQSKRGAVSIAEPFVDVLGKDVPRLSLILRRNADETGDLFLPQFVSKARRHSMAQVSFHQGDRLVQNVGTCHKRDRRFPSKTSRVSVVPVPPIKQRLPRTRVSE